MWPISNLTNIFGVFDSMISQSSVETPPKKQKDAREAHKNPRFNKRIFLSPPHMGGKEEDYVAQAFSTNWIAPGGPNVDAFENEFASYVGTESAVAVSSGTAAIHLSLRLLGVEQDDTVFCSSLTFIGSASPILYLGAHPVFIDSEPETWNMSPPALNRAFKQAERTGKMPKAVVIVNLYGQSADMDALKSICNRYHVPVIEDAAESLGATYKSSFSGTLGKLGVFSFNGNKIITTSGGGMLVSHDSRLIEKAKYWANQAKDPAMHYQHSELGYNYRMSNILAGIGRGQLKVLHERIEAKRTIFARYQEALQDMPGLSFMPEANFGKSNRWLTVLTIDPKATGYSARDLVNALEARNIEARPVWKPLHLQPLFKNCDYIPHSPDRSISEQLFHSGICLPSGSNLSVEDQQRIINTFHAIKSF